MAARYWVGLADTWNGTAGLKWSTTSGGVGGAAVPTSADDVFLDGSILSGNVTLASGYAAVCKSITCTGYVGTLASADATGSLSVQGVGGITFVAGMTLSCTNLLSVSATMPLTAGGKTWGGAMTFAGNAQTFTLIDNWTVTGLLTTGGAANSACTINGLFTIFAGGGYTTIVGLGTTGGTATIEMVGTGTLSSGSYQGNPFRIVAGANTITFSGSILRNGGSWTYVSGTLTTTGSTMYFVGAATTISFGASNTYNIITFSPSSSVTFTLTTNVTCATLNLNSTGNASPILTSSTIYVTGSITQSSGSGGYSGTTNIEMTGTGSWSMVGGAGIANNLTFNSAGTITVSGAVTKSGGTLAHVSGTTVWTSSTLSITAATTLTLGAQVPFNVTVATNSAVTLSASLSITGELKFSSNNPIINGFTWNVGGNLNLSGSPVTVTGTSGILMNGTGTLISANASSSIQLQSFVINTSGTITLPTANYITFAAHATLTTVFTYVAGTIVAGAVKFGSRSGVSFTVTAGTNCRFTNLGLGCIAGSSGTTTLSADLYSSGTITGVGNTITYTMNGFKLYCASMLWDTSSSSVYQGTTNIEFNGSGANTWNATTTATFKNNINFNMAGSLVISGTTNISYSTGTITYTAGTVSHTGTLLITGTCTMNTNGMSWNNMTFSGSPTITLNSLLTLTGTFITTTAVTFAGTTGFTIGTFLIATAGVIITYKATKTYTVTIAMSCVGTSASHTKFLSDSPGSQAIFTLNTGATQTNIYHDGTDIDSSGGQTVWSVAAVLSNTINWNLGSQPAQTASTFVF